MKKIVKVVALLSMAAAVMMGCKNPAGGNTDDPTGGNTTGGNNTPSSEAPAPTDPTTPTTPTTPDTPAPQTKFTNAAWELVPSQAYDGITITLADVLGDTDISKYEALKVNITFLNAENKEIVYNYDNDTPANSDLTGQVVSLGAGDWNPIETVNNVIPQGVSENEGVYIPLSADVKKIAVQNGDTKCKKMKINYIELIEKGEGSVYATLKSAQAALTAGKKAYVAFTMTSDGKGGWGLGGLVDASWQVAEEIKAPATYTPGEVIEVEVSKLADAKNINFYNGASFAYIRIK